MGTAEIDIVVHPLPQLTANSSSPAICDGESATLTAGSDIIGTVWQWSNGSTSNPITVTPTTTTTYTVTGTSPEGCTGTAEVTVIVHPNPVIQASATDTDICNGGSTILTTNSNLAITSWMWSTGDSVNSITVQPNITTTYSITGTTSTGCTGSASLTVQVYALPNVQIIPANASVCFGDSTVIQVTTTSATAMYYWSNGQTGSQIHVQPATTSTYGVTVTDINGCSSDASCSVVVNTLPEISVSPEGGAICNGSSISLTATSSHQNTSYYWSTYTTTETITVSPTVSTIYMVTGTDSNGCSDTASVLIHVMPSPLIQVTPENSSICLGDFAQLESVSNIPGTSFYWSNGSGNSSIIVTPSSSTQYTVSGIAPNGCSGSATAFVTVNTPPVLNITPVSPEICEGENITLYVDGGTQYNWSPAVDYILPSGSQVTVSPDTTTQYFVEGVDANGCIGNTTVTVFVHSNPLVDFVSDLNPRCAGNPVQFYAQCSPINEIESYSWNFGDPSSGIHNISASVNPVHTYNIAGDYWITLEVKSIYGCIASVTKPDYISVYPNPIAAFIRTPDITDITNPHVQIFSQSLGVSEFLYDFGDPDSGTDNFSTLEHPVHTYSKEGEYWIWQYVVNEWGCVDSTRQRVIINPAWELYIPNAFSPNGDGVNDNFFPTGFGIDVDVFSMYIYNRWGEEIFETNDMFSGWDGTVKNKSEQAKQDVYVYLIVIRDVFENEQRYTGNVVLLR